VTSVLRGLFLWDGARNSVTLLLHHGMNSFCVEPTDALRIGVLSPRITCVYYQPHTKSQRHNTTCLFALLSVYQYVPTINLQRDVIENHRLCCVCGHKFSKIRL
jgi:hypothetical protein